MKHIFNENGVCTNPTVHDYSRPGIFALIKVATDGKLWAYGFDFNNLKEQSGKASGVHQQGLKFDSEQSALNAGLVHVFGLNPQVQLKLF